MSNTIPFQTIEQITEEWYSFSLFEEPGEIATNLKHLDQCIKVLLTTPFTSVPHHPDWFTDLNELVDQPVTTVRQSLLEGVTRAIATHEPRVEVLGVAIAPLSDTNLQNLRVTVSWRVKETEIESATEVILPSSTL